jgi:hypothetical protein
MEIWKDIKGYDGKYQVSNLGRVKSLKRWVNNKSNGGYFIKERILKQSKGVSNYLIVGLSKNTKSKSHYVHKLVAEAFLENKNNSVIDHINNISTDNRLSNLQYISHRENTSKDKMGSSKYVGVQLSPDAKKWLSYISIKKNKVYLGSFDDEYRASIAYQFALMQLDKIKNLMIQ